MSTNKNLIIFTSDNLIIFTNINRDIFIILIVNIYITRTNFFLSEYSLKTLNY